MLDPKSQLTAPYKGAPVALGAAVRFPVVLVEASGALGALVAERCCPDETLERVLYFRSLMGEPYARFFNTVELLSMDGFSVARAVGEDEIFFEPSLVPYAIENISKIQYDLFVDNVVDYCCDRAEHFITSLFCNRAGFSVDAEGRLVPPPDYACAMDRFMASSTFVEPHEPIIKNG